MVLLCRKFENHCLSLALRIARGCGCLPLAGPRCSPHCGELEQKCSDLRCQSDREQLLFFFCLPLVCLVRERHKTERAWLGTFAAPHYGAPHPSGRLSMDTSQALGPTSVWLSLSGAQLPQPVSGGQGYNNQLWCCLCGLSHFLCIMLSHSHIYVCMYLYIYRGEGTEKEWERNMDV